MIDPRFEAKVAAALVVVSTPEGQRGTGFVLGEWVVTSAHLCKAASEVTVTLERPNQECLAKVERLDPNSGVALLRPLLPLGRAPLPLGPSEGPPALGQRVLILSAPLRVDHGFVANHPNDAGRYGLDAVLEAHHLGAPILDEGGRVVGLHCEGGGRGAEVASVLALSRLIAEATPLRCRACGGDYAMGDEQCPRCGVVTPLHRGETLLDRPELARSARLVASLLTRLGQDPTACRIDFHRWRTGRVEWSLGLDGRTLAFNLPIGPLPPSPSEGLYRFLLTYSDASAHHARVAIDGAQQITLGFKESVDWLGERGIEARLQALEADASQLAQLVDQGFRGGNDDAAAPTEGDAGPPVSPVAPAFDDGLELP